MATILELYDKMCGKSEVPAVLQRWMGIAAIAATLEDRVNVCIYKGQPIKPQLYIGIVADGSVGKGVAAGTVKDLVKSRPNDPTMQCGREISLMSGRVTYAALLNRLANNQVIGAAGIPTLKPALWLLMEEFSSGMGNDKNVDPFVKLVTDLYTSVNSDYTDDTISRGSNVIVNPCLNWLFCSNATWLRDIITRDVMMSGFIARTIFVFAKPTGEIIPMPIYPPDYDDVREDLLKKLFLIRHWEGELAIDPDAQALYELWLMKRDPPGNPILRTTFDRQREFIWRFAIISVANRCKDFTITVEDMIWARERLDEQYDGAAQLVAIAAESRETRSTNEIEKLIRESGSVAMADLVEFARRDLGYSAKTVKASVDDLIEAHLVRIDKGPHNKRIVVWAFPRNEEDPGWAQY